MTPLRRMICSAILGGMAALSAAAATLADDAKPKVTFKEASAVFNNRCNSCHNGDKKKGGLALDSYLTAMEGGGSGKVIEPGDPDASTLFLLVTHQEQPTMPPNSPKIPDAEIEVLRQWIAAGAPESADSKVAMSNKPKVEFKLDPSQVGKPQGEPAVPQGISTDPGVLGVRPNAILAMAHSPWAPVVAIAAHKQVLLYRTDGTRRLVGVLPFPEGTIHTLKFSRDGEMVLAGGGRGGQSGRVVVWKVKTGERVFEVGKEYDAIMAADMSPDRSMVAMGGPGKVVRVYSTSTGEVLYELRKHTEWVTALEFSPDGVLLASGDRNNGLLVWEALTGREFFDLRGHTAGITDISWRADSNVVASASEDGSIKLWEMNNGTAIKSIAAHGGGCRSGRFALDGRLVSSGRDRMVRVWDQNGGKQKEFEAFPDLALQAVFNHDAAAVIAGDWTGLVRVFNVADGAKLAELSANPGPLAARIDQTIAAVKAAQVSAQALASELVPLQKGATDAVAALQASTNAHAEAQKLLAQRDAEKAAAEKAAAEKVTAEAAAAAALKGAQDALAAANAEKPALEKAIADATAQEKAATDAVAAHKGALAKVQAEKVATDQAITDLAAKLQAATATQDVQALAAQLGEQAKAVQAKADALAVSAKAQADSRAAVDAAAAAKAKATGDLAGLPAKIQAATVAVQGAQAALTAATGAKDVAAKAAADATAAQVAATQAVAAKKAELDQVTAGKAAADKALADKTALLQATQAQAQALQVDADALAAEKKAADAAKAAMVENQPKKS